MAHIRVRPRFTLVASSTPEAVLNRLRAQLEKPEAECSGTILNKQAIIRIPDDQQHYWSPQLNIEVEEHPGGTLVRGLFGPRPTVWTMFASIYGLLIFAIFVGLIYGLSQWSLGMAPYALWSLPVFFVLLVVFYGLAFVGQRLGYEQILLLRSFLDDSLENTSSG